MYACVRLYDNVVVSWGSLPADLVGLSDDALTDLSWVDGRPDLQGLGYLPVVADPHPTAPDTHTVVSAGLTVAEDGRSVTEAWSVVLRPDSELPAARNALVQRIENELADRLSAPFSYNFPDHCTAVLEDGTIEAAGAREIQMRPSDRQVWQMVHQTALAAVMVGQGAADYPTGIRCLDNAVVGVTYAEALHMTTAIFTHGSTLTARSWTLKNRCRTAATMADLAAADLSWGEP